MPAFQHGQLLSESKILQHQTSAGVTDAKEGSKPEPKEVEHGARVTRIPMLFISKAGQNCGEAQRQEIRQAASVQLPADSSLLVDGDCEVDLLTRSLPCAGGHHVDGFG
jgi:hypothetical protein